MIAIINTTVDGIIVIDGRGVVASFNRGAERLFGYGAAEVIGGRLPAFSTTKARGTGLGLPTVKSFIEAHHRAACGRLPASGGTTFTIRLPQESTAQHR